MDGGDWASVVSAGVAVAGAIGSTVLFFLSRGEKAEAARQAVLATQAAVDAAAAESRSADAAERAAQALEEQNRLAAEQQSAAEESPWQFERVINMKFRLRNGLNGRAYGVQLASNVPLRNPKAWDQIDGQGLLNSWPSMVQASQLR